MSYIKRRQFLQFAGSTLATVGLSQADLIHQGDRYGKVLAQDTPRKLALLVGINQYSGSMATLAGCITDVESQQELLIHRFGFKSQDILTLTDQAATRKGILTAFEEHLIKQAKPGDVVVFHYSGHGAQVIDPDHDAKYNSTLVPIDAQLPPSSGSVEDIMGHTLFLLMSALKTENVTVVLDCCHAGGGTRGNLRVRSRDNGDGQLLLYPSPEEINYQQKWLRRLGLSPQKFIELRKKGVAKGVVVAAAQRNQIAADAQFSDFSAGAFTYVLTQYLWEESGNEPINNVMFRVKQDTAILAYQQGFHQNPQLESNLSQENNNPPFYFISQQGISSEAVITQVQGNQLTLWLGGLDSQTLEAFEKDGVFSVLDSKGGERGLVKLESRQGLIGQGKIITVAQNTQQKLQLQPGLLLQERIRCIPNNLTLKIGIDNSFDNRTVQEATQALTALNRIVPKPLGTIEVQYIFGEMNPARYQALDKKRVSDLPPVGSYGLFLPSLEQIVRASFGQSNETVKEAITRLRPKLKSLLATRIIKQILGNTNSSQVNVTASMNIADNNNIVAETFPNRGINKIPVGSNQSGSNSAAKSPKISASGLPQLDVGTQITFQVKNHESFPLYISIFEIDAQGEMTVIFPNDWSASETTVLIEPQRALVIPGANDQFNLNIGEPLGISEALIIASTTPLRTALKGLKEIAQSRGVNRSGSIDIDDEFLDVTNSLLSDLDAGTRGRNNVGGIELPTDVRGIDSKKLAAMGITFEVVGAKHPQS